MMDQFKQGLASTDSYARYQQQAATNVAVGAPRELGILEQASGLSTGLADMHARLKALVSKIAGTPHPDEHGKPCPSGLPGIISDAQAELKACYELVMALDRAF